MRRIQSQVLAVTICALALGLACGAPEPAPRRALKTAPADHHFEAAVAIHDAVSQGALADARARAESFAPRVDPAGFPESWRAFIDPMWTGATTVASAQELTLAAAGVAQMIGSCGGCHHAHGVAVEAPRAEADETQRAATLARHAWAVNRMWDGLAGPSLRAWSEGADVLLDAPLVRLRPGTPPPGPDTMRVVGQVHALASEAHEAFDSGAMMRIYGQLLATCGACHEGQPSRSSPSSASSGQRSMGSGTPSSSASQPKSQPGQPS